MGNFYPLVECQRRQEAAFENGGARGKRDKGFLLFGTETENAGRKSTVLARQSTKQIIVIGEGSWEFRRGWAAVRPHP